MRRTTTWTLVMMIAGASLGGGALVGCDAKAVVDEHVRGMEKREIFDKRVKLAREGQQEAKKEFSDALAQFQAIAKVGGGELQAEYDKLKEELEDAEDAAEDVRDRIKDIESISEDLFEEWEDEIKAFGDEHAEVAERSKRDLARAKLRYQEMHAAMKAAETDMETVLKTFQVTVLSIKHQLNARAFDQLQAEVTQIEDDVTALIQKMDASIEHATKLLEDGAS